jgi:hypothetical protein
MLKRKTSTIYRIDLMCVADCNEITYEFHLQTFIWPKRIIIHNTVMHVL